MVGGAKTVERFLIQYLEMLLKIRSEISELPDYIKYSTTYVEELPFSVCPLALLTASIGITFFLCTVVLSL